jgi:exodeoxyribonuclease III
MKIASWNVNSIKIRLPQVLDWLEVHQPDILGLQETKSSDDRFPLAEIEAAGYQVVFSGQKTYNGVAILSKAAAVDSEKEWSDWNDPQPRTLFATCNGVRVLNVYVPNGQEVGSEKFKYKMAWLEKLTSSIMEQRARYEKLVVLGDFNITPDDRDVHDPEAWREQILCSARERDALKKIFELGMDDTFRLFDQPENIFSWWDYRAAGFRRNAGLRLDLILVTKALSASCAASYVDMAPRKLERPSDHAPVVAEFSE